MRRTAKEFFEEVRAAAIDAERCRSQLEALEFKMHAFGGGGYEPMARSCVDPDKIGRRVAAYVDMERNLEGRMKRDWALIDRACVVLYGEDQMGGGGLDKVKSSRWADALWWRYVAAESWEVVARSTNSSVRPCQQAIGNALAWIDKNRFMSAIIDV